MHTVAVTGAAGHVGSAVVAELADAGYHTVGLDRVRGESGADAEYVVDLLDAGEVYGALARADPDAVVHLGTINAPTSHPGWVTYESNAMSTYHVLEAASELGVDRVCLASSINAMGSIYQDAPMDVRYLPVDEEHPLTPRDPYAVAKHAMEVTADGFGRQAGPPETLASLRFPWVATEAGLREQFVEADRRLDALDEAWHHTTRDALFAYVHVADAAAAARRAVEADYDGHEAFWVTAADTSADAESAALAERFYPDATVRRDLSGTESLVSVEKASRLLGWKPTRSWRDL